MQIKRAASYGFCAGVRVADEKVRKFARLGGSDGRILGQVVHNERVVEEMRDLGVSTVGITAGASTPEYAIDEIETRLMELAGVVGDPGGGTRITGTEAPRGATSAGGRSS